MMSDVALMLEEIRNKLDELELKFDMLNKKVDEIKISPQMIWDINGLRPVEEIEPELIKPTEIFPQPITEAEYKEDNRYAKIEIIYYEVDGVFTTFDDKLVEHLNEEYFGYDNLNRLNAYYNVYLRDEKIHVDYHMIYEGCTSYFAEHKGD